MSQAVVLSVNAGGPKTIAVGERTMDTGFFKEPVRGPVQVDTTGLVGDHVADLERHGGEDQAVYLYSDVDRRWWSAQLGRDLGPGYFGENITLDRWWPQPRIGDRVHFREVSLEVSFPRVPCATLAARVGDPRFLKSFVQASRPGLYFRVLKPGAIAAGDVGQVELGPVTHPTAAALFSLWHKSPRDPGLLRSALASPIARRARPVFEAWLAQCGDAPPRSGFVQGPTNASMPQATVIPVLDYEDVLAATTWLCRAFGFTERLRIGTHRIQLDVGAGAVVLAKGPGPAAEGWSGHSVMVRVAAIDEHFALAKAAGAEVSGAPVSYPYGERQYSAKDLGGHQWTFSQSEADVDPGAWGGQLASSDTPPNAEQLP